MGLDTVSNSLGPSFQSVSSRETSAPSGTSFTVDLRQTSGMNDIDPSFRLGTSPLHTPCSSPVDVLYKYYIDI